MTAKRVRVIFSDLDGTLIHFERHFAKHGARVENLQAEMGTARFVCGEESRECRLLPTSTMGAGLMSERSIELIREIRSLGVHFVYVTGARKSTLEVRLPIMGPVDAAFAETGGRFLTEDCTKLDEEWTAKMETICGPEATNLAPLERQGALWDWARVLHDHGYIFDARDYFFGFRVDLEKQQQQELREVDRFRALVDANMPDALATAMNLGKFDFFPKVSGKGNAVRHYLAKRGMDASEAVALFDDENDLPMADAVGQCYVMQATHPSIEAAVKTNSNWHVATAVGVLATEEVLTTLLEQCKEASPE